MSTIDDNTAKAKKSNEKRKMTTDNNRFVEIEFQRNFDFFLFKKLKENTPQENNKS